jgi:prolyl oligopeptidase PreP (S9A serine peptidase family)
MNAISNNVTGFVRVPSPKPSGSKGCYIWATQSLANMLRSTICSHHGAVLVSLWASRLVAQKIALSMLSMSRLAISFQMLFPGPNTEIQVREVQTTSTDGARIPISIIFRKRITLDGSHPALFEGYGCYGFPIDAEFNPSCFPEIFRFSLACCE